MELTENKSRIWYLVLSKNLKALDSSEESWKEYLPVEDSKGKWKKGEGEEGVRLMSNPLKDYKEGHRLFVVEIKGHPVKEKPGEIWMRDLKILREATSVDIKELGLQFGQE